MKTALKSLGKYLLPPSLVIRLRDLRSRQVDEVAMIAALCHGRQGVMVDVGAHFGSCTARFLSKGWRVVAYEPDAANRAVFIREIGDNARVQLSSSAVSNHEQQGVEFFASDVSTGISGLSAFHASHRPSAKVDTVTLSADLARRGIRQVDFLKVDIEGFDFFALQGFDWTLKPRFVVYEFEERKTRPLGYALSDTTIFMADQDYHLIYSVWEPIKEYGMQHVWRGLFPDPPEDADACWGNVMAFSDLADRDTCLKRFGGLGR